MRATRTNSNKDLAGITAAIDRFHDAGEAVSPDRFMDNFIDDAARMLDERLHEANREEARDHFE